MEVAIPNATNHAAVAAPEQNDGLARVVRPLDGRDQRGIVCSARAQRRTGEIEMSEGHYSGDSHHMSRDRLRVRRQAAARTVLPATHQPAPARVSSTARYCHWRHRMAGKAHSTCMSEWIR